MIKERLMKPKLPLDLKSEWGWFFLFISFVIILFLPWVAMSTGAGKVTAIDPNDRVQTITIPFTGFIKRWHVDEGQKLVKGELIAELADIDPNLLERYKQELQAAQKALESAKLMRDTAEINLNRQHSLHEQGLAARKSYESSKIDFSKHEMEVAKAQVTLTKAQTQLSRLSSQEMRAPRNGTIIRILPGERGQFIKEGSPVAVFSPDVERPAVEIWVDGNDAALIEEGQKAQLQFEGWPSLQIGGWPSLAINTFPGKVHLIDQASSYQNRFRVLITPDGTWPGQRVLRLGSHAKGYIQLSNSFVLREIWRRLNNYPAYNDPFLDEVDKILKEDKSIPGYQGKQPAGEKEK